MDRTTRKGSHGSAASAEFLREDDSVPPLVDAALDDHDDGPPPPSVVHPATLARRARWRWMASTILGFAGVVAVTAAGNSSVLNSLPPSSLPVAAATVPAPTRQEALPAVKSAPVSEREAAPVPEGKPAEPTLATTAKPAEPKAADEGKMDPVNATKLKKEALSYLNRGRYKEAIEAARAAIVADPLDALVYLYLGSALQDLGKWAEGIEAYSACVRNAKKGPIDECIAMGGRK